MPEPPEATTLSPRTIRILLIDDDQGDFEMTRSMIANIDRPDTDYEVEWVSSYPEGLDAFDEDAHDVYFIDYFLEDRDGLDLVREARNRGLRKPLIMLTGRGSHEVDVEAMRAGASDYLVKGKIDPDILERTIRYTLDRAAAERALRASEERHRSMFDHLPIGLYRCAPDGEFMDANPALVRILGYPDPDTLQEEYASTLYVAEKDRHRFEELLKKYGVARGFETTLRRADGSRLSVRNTARAHRDAEGNIQYLEGAVEDVTDLLSAERIRGSAQRFQTVYDRSRLAILLVDRDGLVIDGNPAFRRVFGYTPPELEGRPLSDLVASSDRAAFLEEIRSLAEDDGDDHAEGERRFTAGDGTVLWARTLASSVRDAQGDPDHVMLLLEDVAESD